MTSHTDQKNITSNRCIFTFPYRLFMSLIFLYFIITHFSSIKNIRIGGANINSPYFLTNSIAFCITFISVIIFSLYYYK